jgi:diguanylate cyclase (GGDEF)-like protein
MQRHHRIRLLAIAATAVIAAAVWLAGAAQRSTADRAFRETRSTQELRNAVDRQATHVIAYATSGKESLIEEYRDAGRTLEATLAGMRADHASHGGAERRMVDALTASVRRWQRAADELATDVAVKGPHRLSIAQARRLDTAVDGVSRDNRAFVRFLDQHRDSAQNRIALVTAAVILLLSAIFGGLAYVFFDRPARAAGDRRARHSGFTEVMQLARTESEAYGIVKRHIERIVPRGTATVMNRNNSANRLEPATAVDDPNVAAAVEGAEPETCIAVRSGRAHKRDSRTDELLSCEICGRTSGNATCTPSLVGGEVIGSVLVQHPGPLEPGDASYLESTITEAAPIIANLRTLAVAELRAATDALTGLPNNRSVHETLKRMAAQAGRTSAPLAAVLFDLDHFKQINDVHGHAKGDEVLAAVGDAVSSAVRASDFVGRYGGEEFVALLPDTDREGAVQVADKLRAAIAMIDVPGVSRRVTASFGVAALPFDAVEPEQLLRVADRALYTAKANGRDRVEVALPREDAVEALDAALSSGEDG